MNWIMKENAISMTTEITDLCERLGFNDYVSAEEKTAGTVAIYEALTTGDETYINDLFESLKESAEEYADDETKWEIIEAEDSAVEFLKAWKNRTDE